MRHEHRFGAVSKARETGGGGMFSCAAGAVCAGGVAKAEADPSSSTRADSVGMTIARRSACHRARTVAFLIDTEAIRNRVISLKTRREIFSNRHSSGGTDSMAKVAGLKTGATNAQGRAQIKCHTMPSNFRSISLKTNGRRPREVSHFFKTGLPVSTASRAWEIRPLGSPISRLAVFVAAKRATAAALKAAALHLDLGKGKGARLKGGRYIGNGERPYEDKGCRSEDRRYDERNPHRQDCLCHWERQAQSFCSLNYVTASGGSFSLIE